MMPYIGEIRMTAFDYAPRGWFLCSGSELDIRMYEQLYEIIGTTYGGDGKWTFNLPNLQGRIPIHYGQGENLPDYALNQRVGSEFITLQTNAGQPGEGATYVGNSETGLINIQPILAVNFIICWSGINPK
jgi:microcystin-dependent protein